MEDPDGPDDAGPDRAGDGSAGPDGAGDRGRIGAREKSSSPVGDPAGRGVSGAGDPTRTDREADERPPTSDEEEGNVAGILAPDLPVEPGELDPVNAIFVALGAYVGVLAVATFLGVGGRFGLGDYVAITVGYAVLAAVVYLLLARNDHTT